MESQAFSFIIRIWIDTSAGEVGERTWHGQVTRVPGDEMRYVTSLDEVADFITEYLPQSSARWAPARRLWQRLPWFGRPARQNKDR